ncbi:myosin tail region-interacting protein MTI1 [Rhypophila decipiens]
MAFKVKAVYEYSSPHEDDLNFPLGQIITVTEEEDAEWYSGEYVDDAGHKHEGIFPRNFVEKYEPTAPPRPTRTRTKKEPEPEPEPPAAIAPRSPPRSPTLRPESHAAVPEPEHNPQPVSAPAPTETISSPPPLPASFPEPVSPKQVQPPQFVAPPPAPRPVEAPAPAAAPKPAPTQRKASGPPPVAEKPSSFKDRIAAFNKAAAPPVAPFKPGGLGSGSTGFIKKPFVAPPPSRNAYIPPVQQAPTAKVYRRDEDPEIREQEAETLENAGRAGLVPTSQPQEGEDDQPKPMSLKERLALLQKQQQETAARHADALAKKDKPKRPPKKRTDTQESAREGELAPPLPVESHNTEEAGKSSLDEAHPPRVPHAARRKSSRGTEPNDGNEADMSGAGETTEGQEELTERDEAEERKKHVATVAKQEDDDQNEEEDEEEEEEEEEEDIDPEVRRKEELRARMARMAGGMGMPGMPGIPLFGAPPPMMAKKKKASTDKTAEESHDLPSPRAPPVPTMMALPGMSRPQPDPQPQQQQEEPEVEEDEDDSRLRTPHQETAPGLPSKDLASPPPVPGGRPAPPPVPSESRPPPLPRTSSIRSPSEGSESDDELSERPQEESDTPKHELTQSTRAPPPPPVALPPAPQMPPLPPVSSPRATEIRRDSYADDTSPVSPTSPQNRRASRLPPPIPGAAPAPPPAQTRPPPPPPPGAAPPISRTSTSDAPRPPTASHAQNDGEDEEVTEYEGDYDTDIASSAPHKDALKAHQREPSFEEAVSPRSPTTEAPPPPPSMAPRAPPPIPAQSPPSTRKSTDMPRMAPPPPPPPGKDAEDDDYDPYNYGSGAPPMPSYPLPTPPPHLRHSEEPYSPEMLPFSPPQNSRAPPPAPPPGVPGRSVPPRQSLDVQRGGPARRSVDVARPSMESGFVANDIDLANNSGWWLQPNNLPPQLQGRKDIYSESDESTSADPQRGGRMIVTRDIYILYQDYSQTVITVRFDPQNILDVELEQRHEAPPRALRQDQLEQSYERFGRAIGEAVSKQKDTVVGDGTPQALVFELLKPFKDALYPVGTRAYGALVYSNLANASTSQNDEIRPGDIISIRNARFQGKHGAMHAKYSAEVGKPDHVAIVAEWDGTKKKVRAWEQGRESKKVKMESFKLDDLRSGEVKIWRVMPRSWIGWESGN